MWSVWNSSRMQGYITNIDIITTHKISIYIIQHLIAIYIAMIIRGRNSIWMVIVKSWYKTTNDQPSGLEGLMHWWRLMNSPCYRFKIVNRESIWKVMPIITNYIKRMCSIYHFNNFVFFLYFHQKRTHFIMWF